MPSLTAPYLQLYGNYPRITYYDVNHIRPTVLECPNDPNGPQCVRAAMKQFGSGTSCCVQISHALNLSGIIVPSASIQRSPLPCVNGFYYLGNPYELEDFLTNRNPSGGFAGEVLRDVHAGNNPAHIQDYLQGRQGILLFRDYSVGKHTELWDGQAIVQTKWMDNGWVWSQPKILFWDAGLQQQQSSDGNGNGDDSDC